ncbi:methionine--tRNA ligase subunit beta [Edaphobacter modestus]|uniref:Methionine--tRNA ligase n=1 Tax=Edaphobacter modestus TaxID=388466 RepID=A0A4Q7Z0N3_9BACT|nr:methionine--tRNA ligase subunit beta [Edaphobacter modestus]RZU43161.1 methionyl-tRNA synthetase [Edaphobacter modestus]
MSDAQKKFYLTTPIYYVNARPHIGHAYTTIAADVIARRQRLLLGTDNVWFLTGTDEHGQKIQRSAEAAGIPPQRFADQVSEQFRSLWQRMGITYNDYIRTTEPRHTRGVQRLFAELYSRGHIYLDTYTGQYSVGEEMFVDGPPGTIGPDGKPTETVTEENFYFRLSSYQAELIDRIEADEDDPKAFRIEPEARRNEVLSFLRGNVAAASSTEGVILSEGGKAAESKDLRFSSKGNPYVPGALKDLSISRSSFDWGIPVPEPAASRTTKKHVIYVWLDALTNYMTAVGYGSDDPAQQEQYKKFWPADLHLVGKEIIRFHCVYWPAFLLAAGVPLPKKVQAHGWLLFEESKMSKSRGNIVRTETILDAFGSLLTPKPVLSTSSTASSISNTVSSRPERSGVEGSASPEPPPPPTKAEQDLFASDVLRYFLLREIPFGQDGSFSFDALVQRYNSDLANGYGNLVSRTLSMIRQYFSTGEAVGRLSGYAPVPPLENDETSFPLNEAIRSSVGVVLGRTNEAFEENDFGRLLESVWSLIGTTDSFISEKAPWKLAKLDSTDAIITLRQVLYSAAESIRIITALLYPVLPYSTAKVWDQLGLGDIEAAARNGELNDLTWGSLKPGTKLGQLGPIFPRADKGLIQIMTDAEQNGSSTPPTPSKFVDEKTTHTAPAPSDPTHPGAAPRTSLLPHENPGTQVGASSAPVPELARPPAPHSEAPASGVFAGSAASDTQQIAIDDFVKIELRVAKVLVAERIPKADKLLRLEVDLGYEKRQILSGIAQWYTPEDLIGRRIIIVANLAPRKMRGLESHGMLLAASHGEDGKPILATFAESDEIELGSRLK